MRDVHISISKFFFLLFFPKLILFKVFKKEMRISYALILAAIAVMEGCKPKDAATTSGDGDKKNGEK